MKKIIHNLRSQPESIKIQILHFIMIFFAVVLFFTWTMLFSKNVSETNASANLKEELKPFSILKENLSDGYESISNTGW
jgi:flagellar basal body-associated protein FliL